MSQEEIKVSESATKETAPRWEDLSFEDQINGCRKAIIATNAKYDNLAVALDQLGALFNIVWANPQKQWVRLTPIAPVTPEPAKEEGNEEIKTQAK